MRSLSCSPWEGCPLPCAVALCMDVGAVAPARPGPLSLPRSPVPWLGAALHTALQGPHTAAQAPRGHGLGGEGAPPASGIAELPRYLWDPRFRVSPSERAVSVGLWELWSHTPAWLVLSIAAIVSHCPSLEKIRGSDVTRGLCTRSSGCGTLLPCLEHTVATTGPPCGRRASSPLAWGDAASFCPHGEPVSRHHLANPHPAIPWGCHYMSWAQGSLPSLSSASWAECLLVRFLCWAPSIWKGQFPFSFSLF